ncbi:TPA: hypothetical protein RJ957_002476 [Enterobacter hormaechei]|uniref:hypothetical protein n=1 Tax=Enterobacter hormaechei TaxID=158836 RepID=UPI0011429260|nr:hypothetical protein [Enterobacter hormaechei]HCT3226295.1 hypothetical protein [Enterobacter hormaechei]HDV8253255.1 hypothetical protein [Enterobacter hormaechei]
MATEKAHLLSKATAMASDRKARYDSIELYFPEDQRQKFIDSFDEVGLHAGVVRCFSAKPSTVKEFLSVLYERGKAYAPLILKALKCYREKSIKIEICSDRSIIDLKVFQLRMLLKIIKASNAIKVSHIESI